MVASVARVLSGRLGWNRRRSVALLLASSVPAACLDDTPTRAGPPTVRATLSANVVNGAAGSAVRIRIGYRASRQGFVALPSSPDQVGVTPATTLVLPVTVDIGPCLADQTRFGGAAEGCVLTVELTLSDAAGEVIDQQTRDARTPATPGQSVDFGTVTIGVTVSAITVAPASLGMNLSDERQLVATVRDNSGAVTTTPAVSWTTSDATVAQLSATTGAAVTVRALKLG